MKAQILVIDSPYTFDDKLSMSNIKRSPESQYKSVLSNEDILNLDIKSISDNNAILALWVPSSILDFGLECMKAYGFNYKQTWIWVKSKKDPFKKLKKNLKKEYKKSNNINNLISTIDNFNINECFGFFMGRIFRQTHEICLIGTRGKIHKDLKNKSQISVFCGYNLAHSTKPEALQDKLELMYPNYKNRVELFARRNRDSWFCMGNELSEINEFNGDIRNSIEKFKNK